MTYMCAARAKKRWKEMPPKKITWAPACGGLTLEQYEQWEADPGGLDIKLKECVEYHNLQIDNLRDYFQVLEKQKITHLLLDGINNTPLINDELRLHLIDIFNHENKYPFLVKEYDSRENGFNYHVKLFKINYNLYDE